MNPDVGIIVIGAGIAGASVASHLAITHQVLLLEMEDRPGYHSTGRSIATFEPNYGPAPIRALTRASRREFDQLLALAPRESLFLMPLGQQAAFDRLMAGQKGMREISAAEAKVKFPLLRSDYVTRAVLDPVTADIDVDLLLQSYLRKFRSSGGTLLCGQGAETIKLAAGQWTITTKDHTFRTRIIVNAAGAWGGQVAALAGAAPVVLQPKRRSVAVISPPAGFDIADWPWIGDVAETWYCKPQSGKLLVSPADAAPADPHDAHADDMALAEGIDRFQQAADFEVTRVEHSWGGLRSFAQDGNPVVGYDNKLDGFFWLIGQGGYGIQTAPALSRLAAALVRREDAPADILDEGLMLDELRPSRFG